MAVFAFGNVSVGFVAFARWLAIGAVAISPISIGLWALGLVAIGLEAAGPFSLALKELPFWQALIIVFAMALVGGFFFNRHKARRPADKDDLLDELALFSHREWRDAGASLRGGRVIAICGRYLVDLTEVESGEGEIAIEADVLLGAIRIRVPEGWHVKIDGQPILGRFNDDRFA